MIPKPAANPFTLVYDELWSMVTRNKNLDKWLKPNNKIDFQKWLGGKDEISAADLPELTLLVDSTFGNLQSSSNTTSVTKIYSWILVTGDYRIDDIYNQITWELFRSMVDWDKQLCALSWENSTGFVVNTQFLTSAEGTAFADLNRQIQGWACSWPIQVEMRLLTADLRI